MTKLELSISTTSACYECSARDEFTAKILGFNDGYYPTKTTVPLANIMADDSEYQSLRQALEDLVEEAKRTLSTSTSTTGKQQQQQQLPFKTLNLVFSAPGIDTTNNNDVINRKTLDGVYASPMRAIHGCGEMELACFTSLQIVVVVDDDNNNIMIHLTALEYSRHHRQELLQQEFGSWLLEHHIEKAVIATTMLGEVVFWNDHATKLYQYTHDEAMGQNIVELTPSDMAMEDAIAIMSKLQQGQPWKGMFSVQRKDKSTFMAHISDTPIMDINNTCQFIVGVSDDYTQLHDTMEELERLNCNLDKQVQTRTRELLERERDLRNVGAAIQASDTGVCITNGGSGGGSGAGGVLGDHHKIIWANDAMCRQLRVKVDDTTTTTTGEEDDHEGRVGNDDVVDGSSSIYPHDVRNMRPWELPVCQKESEVAKELKTFLKESLMGASSALSNNNNQNNNDNNDNDDQQQQQQNAKIIFSKTFVFRQEILSLDALSVTIQRLPGGDSSSDHHQQQHMITFRDQSAQWQANEAKMEAKALASASNTKTEMMQMLSHELRTPLQGIMGLSSTMLLDVVDNNNNDENDGNNNNNVVDNDNDDDRKNNNNSKTKQDSTTTTTAAGAAALSDGLSMILASSRLLLTLINNVLDVRKMDLNMIQDVDIYSVPVMECIEESLSFCEPFAIATQVQLEIMNHDASSSLSFDKNNKNNNDEEQDKSAATTWCVHANKLRLQQILVNIVTNGVKYTKSGTKVIVSIRKEQFKDVLKEMRQNNIQCSDLYYLPSEEVEKLDNKNDEQQQDDDDVIVISIRDHGKGIPMEETSKVFAEFQQLKNSNTRRGSATTAQPSGSGLGLNLVMKFLRRMNGHVWFQNCKEEDGGGVQFNFCLPAAESTTTSTLHQSFSSLDLQTATNNTNSNQGGGTGETTTTTTTNKTRLTREIAKLFRVLVVDDSVINLKVLARMLHRVGVTYVETAPDGPDALRFLTDLQAAGGDNDNDDELVELLPNLIISDLQMPEMTGDELVKHIIAMNLPSQPFLVAGTADWTSQVEVKCRESGFHMVLRKPITIRDLEEFLLRSTSHLQLL